MKKLYYKDIKNETLVDIRSQKDYQTGHISGSLNLNPKNFKKYATDFLTLDQPIVFTASKKDENELKEAQNLSQELGFNQIKGYILIDELPDSELEKTSTISAEEFLSKKEGYLLLDVRNPEEITRPAPEKNLASIPLENLSKDYHSLDRDKEIYTLCGSGNRGTSAASYLSSKGFKSTVIEGGMKAVQESSK